MIEGQATIEDEDAYGTVFSYDASKRAFEAWEGNIREMHRGEAVGRALEVEFDDDNKAILVRAFISKGAESTWQKIQDGTLRGFSVGAKAPKSAWKTIERNGKQLPYLTSYRLVELSVVDNPATPKCDFAIIRAEGYTEVLALDAELEGADTDTHNRDLSTTMAGLHSIRDTAMSQCGCGTCYGFLAGSYGRSDEADVTSEFTPALERLDAISAGLATRNTDMAARFAAMERQLAAITQLVQQSVSKADEQRTELASIQATVERVATQPLPASSGPIRNTNGASVNQLDERALLKAAAEKGLLSSDDQMAAAAKLLLGHRK
jgi:phage head maturation protease